MRYLRRQFRFPLLPGFLGMVITVLLVFNFFFLFQFFYSSSSALFNWSSTQVLLNNWATFCAGGLPNVQFFSPTWLWWGSNPRPPDYQADILPPDHAAPPFSPCFEHWFFTSHHIGVKTNIGHLRLFYQGFRSSSGLGIIRKKSMDSLSIHMLLMYFLKYCSLDSSPDSHFYPIDSCLASTCLPCCSMLV